LTDILISISVTGRAEDGPLRYCASADALSRQEVHCRMAGPCRPLEARRGGGEVYLMMGKVQSYFWARRAFLSASIGLDAAWPG